MVGPILFHTPHELTPLSVLLISYSICRIASSAQGSRKMGFFHWLWRARPFKVMSIVSFSLVKWIFSGVIGFSLPYHLLQSTVPAPLRFSGASSLFLLRGSPPL